MKAKVFVAAMAVALLAITGSTLPLALAAPQQQTIIITSAADSGPGTLREALTQASSGAVITFDPTAFPPDDHTRIFPLSPLPALSQGQITIDASNAGVVLDGSQLPPGEGANGLTIPSSGNTIRGLRILGFPEYGITLQSGAQDNTIGGDRTVGVAPTGQGNVISGNGLEGVRMEGAGTDRNLVIGNFIGTDATGSSAQGNGFHGVAIVGGAQYNQVGADAADKRNIISGNASDGVFIHYSGTMFNTVIGNYIGTDASGTVPIPNGNFGVNLGDHAQANLIGGDGVEINVISGNRGGGVNIAGSGVRENTLRGNFIGVDAHGNQPLPNFNGVVVGGGASYNTVQDNIISGNGMVGVLIEGSDATANVVAGNHIGTDSSGEADLGNVGDGVHLRGGTQLNVIGPGNTIAYNNDHGVSVLGPDTQGNAVTANSIYSNGGSGILNGDGGNRELEAPTVSYVGTRTIRGTAAPNARVEIFLDENNQGRIFEGSTMADENGGFIFTAPVGTFAGPHVTATATDGEGNTSQFSVPEPPRGPAVTRELPGIVGPTQVSVEPAVVGANLGLALFCVAFFGLTSNIFNSILKDHRDDMIHAFGRLVPQAFRDAIGRIRSSSGRGSGKGRGGLLLMWMLLLLLTSLIESFLDPEIAVLSNERFGLVVTLFVSAVAVSGLELGSDVFARRRWSPTTRTETSLQWVGIALALACVILSRALDFKPGYLYGIVGAVYLLPELTGVHNPGKRALLVLMTILAGGFGLWLVTAFLPPGLAEVEPVFLTIFLISLQGVFFALIPLAFTDGGDILTWRKGAWAAVFAVVLFCFYHFVLNPNSPDVQAVQQNGVQTLLALIVVFGLATLFLWILFPFRLQRARLRNS